jgi:hypothetical protein
MEEQQRENMRKMEEQQRENIQIRDNREKKFLKLEEVTVYPLVIRELRKQSRVKIFEQLERKTSTDVDYKNICLYMKNILKKENSDQLSQIIKKLKSNLWNKKNLQSLFMDNNYNNELNEVAHPHLNEYKNLIIKSGEFNTKMYFFLFPI